MSSTFNGRFVPTGYDTSNKGNVAGYVGWIYAG